MWMKKRLEQELAHALSKGVDKASFKEALVKSLERLPARVGDPAVPSEHGDLLRELGLAEVSVNYDPPRYYRTGLGSGFVRHYRSPFLRAIASLESE